MKKRPSIEPGETLFVYVPPAETRVRIVALHQESHLKDFDVAVGSVLDVKQAEAAVEPGWVNLWPVGLGCAGFCRVEPCPGHPVSHPQ